MANGLPPGWNLSRNIGDRPVIASKHLNDFVYAEITYDYDDHKYHVWKVNRDGPVQREPRGGYDSLNKAFNRGDELD